MSGIAKFSEKLQFDPKEGSRIAKICNQAAFRIYSGVLKLFIELTTPITLVSRA